MDIRYYVITVIVLKGIRKIHVHARLIELYIAVQLLFFNNFKSLERLIPTIYEFVDLIISVDGRHWTNKKYNEMSTDGSRELLSSYDKVILESINDYEWKKRQRVNNLCRINGYPNMIVIDSDEYAIGNWEVFKDNWQKAIVNDTNNYGLYKVEIQRTDSPHEIIYSWRPVLWRNPWEFFYQGRHDYFCRHNEEPVSYIRSYQNVEGIKLNHDYSLRTKESMNIRQEIIEWQQQVDPPL